MNSKVNIQEAKYGDYRTEIKHIITTSDAIIIRNKLNNVVKLDPNSREDYKYHIRSLYFDTAEDKAVYEKLDGVPFREKFRIRLYNHNHQFIRLEKKSKNNGAASKLGATLTKEEVLSILSGDIDFLFNSNQTLLREFYLKLRTERLLPKIIVDYSREAYFCSWGNVRVTIDSQIKSSNEINDFFNPDLINIYSMNPDICVLEVKYNQFLPDYVQDLIQLNNCSASAVSKYVICRNYY
jgi:hypothetical protein